MGYGARALKALNAYYSGEYFNLEEEARAQPTYADTAAVPSVCLWLSCHDLKC
jgi:N-acetyltransferase 10